MYSYYVVFGFSDSNIHANVSTLFDVNGERLFFCSYFPEATQRLSPVNPTFHTAIIA
jgi:hypothetical protein